jgi:hypothetical protein
MTLQDESIETIIKAFKLIDAKYSIDFIALSVDSKSLDVDPLGGGVSHTSLYDFIRKNKIPKNHRVVNVLRNLIAKLKIKYPMECEQGAKLK